MQHTKIEKGTVVDRNGAAAALGMDPRVIQKLVTGGWLEPVTDPAAKPTGSKNRKQFFRLADVVSARIKQAVGQRIGDGELLDAPQARARRDMATAALSELSLKEREGQLLDADEVLKVNGRIVSAVRSKLLLFPQVWSDRAHKAGKLHDVSGVERVLQTAVDETLTELSEMKTDTVTAG